MSSETFVACVVQANSFFDSSQTTRDKLHVRYMTTLFGCRSHGIRNSNNLCGSYDEARQTSVVRDDAKQYFCGSLFLSNDCELDEAQQFGTMKTFGRLV